MTRTSSLAGETIDGGHNDVEKVMDSQETPSQMPNEPKSEKIDRVEHKNTRDFGIIPIPTHLRYDPEKQFHFGLALNIAFGCFSTFSKSIFACSKHHEVN